MQRSYYRETFWKQAVLAGLVGMLTLSCSQGNHTGADHPPASLAELFGDTLISADGRQVGLDAIEDKAVVAIYFSAEWCPPCRAFTPLLVEAARTLKAEDKSFEVVFVSSDRNTEDMLRYMKNYDMPWLALPHGGKHASMLSHRYGVRGIPTLIIIDGQGNTVSVNGRNEIIANGAAAYDNWLGAAR